LFYFVYDTADVTLFVVRGDDHRYFNPYESPYEAYINYMNIIDDLSRQVQLKKGEKR